MTKRLAHVRTVVDEVAKRFERAAEEEASNQYPIIKYQSDPFGYVKERLNVEIVLPHQRLILEMFCKAVLHVKSEEGRKRYPPRIACRSGQKIGKTELACWLALWFYECFPDAKVMMCAAIQDQTKNVLWRGLYLVIERAKKLGVVIDGDFAQSPAGGFVSSDKRRSIMGISGREIEAVAGYSGRQLVIVDEASHMPQRRSEAFAGNALGGECYMLWISNPTRNDGPFYEAFYAQSEWWQSIHVDAEKFALECEESRMKVPSGITSMLTIREAEAMYGGRDSPFFIVRVKGEFLRDETGHAISMSTIELAEAKGIVAKKEGHLSVGYDCAGPGNGGDEHCWAIVRGSDCVEIVRARGLNEEQALVRTYAILDSYRLPGELPRLLVDSEGPIGSPLFGRFRAELEHRRTYDPGRLYEIHGVKGSSRHVHDRDKFERVRDELWWNLARWMRVGSIPSDLKLRAELHAPIWKSLPSGLLKITPKPELEKVLGRSPDSADALSLAVYYPATWTNDSPGAQAQASVPAMRGPEDASAWAWDQAAATDGGLNEEWWPTG